MTKSYIMDRRLADNDMHQKMEWSSEVEDDFSNSFFFNSQTLAIFSWSLPMIGSYRTTSTRSLDQLYLKSSSQNIDLKSQAVVSYSKAGLIKSLANVEYDKQSVDTIQKLLSG